MVPARPRFMGRPGWVRSSAWIWLFSSIDSTTAWAGGSTYRPTTSLNFSANCGSLESLNVFIRCGVRPLACQMRCTLTAPMPAALAIARTLQCVVSPGGGAPTPGGGGASFRRALFGLLVGGIVAARGGNHLPRRYCGLDLVEEA